MGMEVGEQWFFHHSPKRIIFLIWEIAHSCLNTSDRLQKRCPWILHADVYAIEKVNSPSHLFLNCSFVTDRWMKILEAFNWHIVLPNGSLNWSNMLLIDHPFKNAKETLWTSIVVAVFGRYGTRETLKIFRTNPNHPEMFLNLLSSMQSFGVNLYQHFKATVFLFSLKIGNIFCLPYKRGSFYISLDISFDQWNCFLSRKNPIRIHLGTRQKDF